MSLQREIVAAINAIECEDDMPHIDALVKIMMDKDNLLIMCKTSAVKNPLHPDGAPFLPFDEFLNVHAVVQSFYQNTWFSQEFLKNIVWTVRGSLAGMPLADIVL